MSTITRSDGSQFVIQAYRELLTTNKKSLLAQEIRLLAEQHGQYVYLSKKDNNQFEAAFSSETGYLLAEAIWAHFSRPDNLVFVETIPGSTQVLLIVVRTRTVYLDAKILASNLRAELVPLMTQNHTYRIITSGDVLLHEQPSEHGFTFPKELISSFEKLDELLFPQLPLIPELRMQPLASVLKSQHLSNRYSLPLALIGLIIVLALGWWWLSSTDHQQMARKPVVIKKSIQISPLQKALRSPSPQRELQHVAALLSTFYLLPGWQLTQLTLANQTIRIQLSSTGGDLVDLTQWLEQQHYLYQLSAQGIIVQPTLNLPNRERFEPTLALQPTLINLIEKLNCLLPGPAITLNQITRKQTAKNVLLTIRLHDDTPNIIEYIGDAIKQMPVVLSNVNLQIQSGLVNGTIVLSLWGS